MRCINPVRIFPPKKFTHLPDKNPDGILVPCGKCVECRIHIRKEWSLRMLHELTYHKDSIFITLTYDQQHVPEHKSLDKEELQRFIKRLRKNLGKERKIKYFACGEYGEPSKKTWYGMTEGDRPHYHMVIFGMSLKENDKNLISLSWRNGNVHFGLAEKDSINYVAQYINKKLSGELEEEQFTKTNRQNVFRLLSNGLGKQYCLDNAEQLKTNLCCTVEGKKVSIPRYYLKLLKLDYYEELEIKNHSIEEDIRVVEKHTGLSHSSEELYKYKVDEYAKLKNQLIKSKAQNEKTQEARIKLKELKKNKPAI